MNKRERRELIAENAKRIFVRKGYHDTTVSDIIEDANIARSTFYNHFTGKQEIFQLLLDRYVELLLDAILGINLSKASRDLSLAEQIREMTVPLVRAIDANREMTLLIITAPQGHDNDFDRSVARFFGSILEAVKRLLVEGIEGSTIRSLNPDIIATVILGSAKQILLQWIVYGEIENIYETLDDIIGYTLFGIAEAAIKR